MNGDLLERIRTFVRAVETGSFTAVAKEAGSTQATVSRHIGSLESHLGVRLFNRTTRSMTLTEEGQSYYVHALSILDSVEQAEGAVRPRRDRVTGTLRVAGPLAFTRLQIIPRIGRFLARYPEVKTDFVLGDRPIDLVEEGIDVGIRIGEIRDESLIARLVGETRRITVARPDLFADCPMPKRPSDPRLAQLYSLFVACHDEHLVLQRPGDGPARKRGGLGIGSRECLGGDAASHPGRARHRGGTRYGSSRTSSRQVNWSQCSMRTNRHRFRYTTVYPSRRMITPRVRAFVDFIAEEFRGDPRVAAAC